jgi:hypothetical protein
MDLAEVEAAYAKLPDGAKPAFFEELRALPSSVEIVQFVRARILDEKDAATRELAASAYLDRTMKYANDAVGVAQRAGHLALLRDGSASTRKSVLHRLEGKTGHR